ncbi:Uncharacterized protein At2g39920 [Linum perenne]
MSAYAHQMEREYSAGSLSSAEDSGRGSRYVMESGFYMTSFAATIFIALLVTVGVLMVSLLILLTVMLQACESRSSGVVEMQTRNANYHYCKSYAMHAELNSLDSLELPPECRDLATHDNKVDEYERDLTSNLQVVEGYFDKVAPSEDGKDAVLIDAESILISSPHFSRSLRSDDEMKLPTIEYFSRRRLALETEGFRITAIISRQMDALTGPCPGSRIFKLPNPEYYYVQYSGSSNVPERNTFPQ